MQSKTISQNIIWNLTGQVVPLLAALFAIPTIIHAMGIDRFGILTLLLSFLAYSNLFDFGIGLALTHLLSEKLISRAGDEDISAFIWSALLLLLLLGLSGALIATALSHWLVQYALQIPEALRPETLNSFLLFSATVPAIIISSGIRSILQTYQRFDLINIVQIPVGTLNFLIPFFVVSFSRNLTHVICPLIAIQATALAVYISFLFRLAPFLTRNIITNPDMMKSLLRFGGWLTISNVVGPFMVYLDRFFLGAILSISVIAYYTTPYDVITKLWIIPTAFCGPLFAAFSANYRKDLTYTTHLFIKGIKFVFLILFPIILIVMTFASESLQWWISPDFAHKSSSVLKWLSLGIFINSLAQIAINLVIGVSKPNLSAKLHLIELPFYLLLLWGLIKIFGIEGAAMAWAIRAVIDAAVLFILTIQILSISQKIVLSMITTLLAAILLFAVSILLKSVLVKCFFVLSVLIVFFIAAWKFMLDREDHLWLKNFGKFNI